MKKKIKLYYDKKVEYPLTLRIMSEDYGLDVYSGELLNSRNDFLHEVKDSKEYINIINEIEREFFFSTLKIVREWNKNFLNDITWIKDFFEGMFETKITIKRIADETFEVDFKEDCNFEEKWKYKRSDFKAVDDYIEKNAKNMYQTIFVEKYGIEYDLDIEYAIFDLQEFYHYNLGMKLID